MTYTVPATGNGLGGSCVEEKTPVLVITQGDVGQNATIRTKLYSQICHPHLCSSIFLAPLIFSLLAASRVGVLQTEVLCLLITVNLTGAH